MLILYLRNTLVLLFAFAFALPAFSQVRVKGIIADSITKQPLPFATVRAQDQKKNVISGLHGQFSFDVPSNTTLLYVSYVSYKTRSVSLSSLKENDTIFLVPVSSAMTEVVVVPQTNKIRRIINTAIRNKPEHNPELYDAYQCNIYYKMKVDLLANATDSTIARKPQPKKQSKRERDTASINPDSSVIFSGKNHLLLSETYSKRFYKRPQQLQEIVTASRFSGLKRTYFTNLITDVLPFHVYGDYIPLNGKDYNNPIAKGWQQRYDFQLADEIVSDNDTTFILTFEPKKGVGFNSLKGLVYINNDGYAISHFIASTSDTASGREIRLEQVYMKHGDKWFPQELNYDFIFRRYLSDLFTLQINGRSAIDSVSYTLGKFKFDKAYSVKLHDSVDLRSEADWEKLRMDSITEKERNTYRVVDSLAEEAKAEKIVAAAGQLSVGRFPVNKIDIDLTRLLAFNSYEKTRLGIGLYTNDKLSKYFSAGGWFGYGFGDKKIKYGASLTFIHKGNKDNWLRFFYNDDYRNTGNIRIHDNIDRNSYRNWLLTKVDRIKEFGITAHTQRGYWDIELTGAKQKVSPWPGNIFLPGQYEFDVKEVNLGLKYAYGEKRVPVFGHYISTPSKYPVFYVRTGIGDIKADAYNVKYLRVLGAITFNKHINRWGNDVFQLEAGLVHAFDDRPISRSFLFGAKGFRREGINYFAWGGFLTMRSYDYYSDKYFSLLYRHEFDKFLWQLKFSKPFIGLSHNLMYGSLTRANKLANHDIATPISGYHESGLMLNHLLQVNFAHVAYIYLNAGAFYHWTPSFNWQKNGIWVMGFSVGF